MVRFREEGKGQTHQVFEMNRDAKFEIPEHQADMGLQEAKGTFEGALEGLNKK